MNRVKGENEMTKKILRDNAIGKEESTARGKALDWLGARLLAVLPAVFPSARADDVSSAFAGYAVQPVPAVRTLAAFDDPEFEGRGASCVKETACVTRGPRFGYNGSGGLRVHPKPATKVRLDFTCKETLLPGRKYVFSILRRRNENGFAHLFWSCFDKSGKEIKANWNMKCRKLPGGWESVEVEVAPPTGVEIAQHAFSTIVQATGFKAEEKNNPNAWVDFDLIGLREDVPEWLVANTWPIHNRIHCEEGRVRLCSSFVGEVVPPSSSVRHLVELFAADDGRKLGACALKDEAGVFTADFGPLAEAGDARLKVSLMDDTRRVCAGVKEIPVTVTKRPAAKPGVVSVAEDGRCYKDGKTYLPIGFFTSFGKGGLYDEAQTARRLRELRENGYNCITEYWPDKWNKAGSTYYDLCRTNGIDILYNLNQIYHNASDEGIARFCSLAEDLSVHPAIVGWYAFDEVTKDWAPFLEKFRRALEKRTPDKVIWYVNIHEPEPLLPCGDIQGGDCYPIDIGHDLVAMDAYVEKCLRCRPAAAWHCPQAMNWGNYRPALKNDRERYLKETVEPTENQYLSVALLYAAHGVKGFIFYHFQDIFTGPVPEFYEPRWAAFKSIGRTLRGLEPFIMGGRPIVRVPHVDVKGQTRLVQLEAADGRRVILAIGLTQDNACTFAGPDGAARTFRGGAFSCEIFR